MYSAGVLLYVEIDRVIYFLLGKDFKYRSWSDFGGKYDSEDDGCPMKTAAREFYEETCGVIMSKQKTYDLIKERGQKIMCSSYKQNEYYMYLLRYDDVHSVPYLEERYRRQSHLMRETDDQNVTKYREKSEIKWFSESFIINNPQKLRSVFHNSFVRNVNKIRHAVHTVCA